MKKRDILIFASGAFCVVLVGLAAQAAPFTPRQKKLPDELRCLTGLTRVQLEFLEPPEALVERGLTLSTVETMSRQMFREEEIEVVDDSTAPTFVLSFRAMEDASVPDVLGYAAFVEVKQHVRLIRLEDDQMFLPPATLLDYGLKPDHEVADAALRKMASAIRKLVGFVSVATDRQQQD